MSAFAYTGTDPRVNKVFNKAMSQQSTLLMTRILETYKGFEGIETLVDVGGGIGASLKMIVSKYPSIKGINFDLRHVIQHAPSHPGTYSITILEFKLFFELVAMFSLFPCVFSWVMRIKLEQVWSTLVVTCLLAYREAMQFL